MEAVPANCLGDVRSVALEVCVIGIDEGQFVSSFFLLLHVPSVQVFMSTCLRRNSLLTEVWFLHLSFQTQWSSVRRWLIWERP